MELIYLKSDPLPDANSVNKRVATSFIEQLVGSLPGLVVTEIDLNRDPPPYYDTDLFRYVWQPMSDPGYQPSDKELQAAEYMRRHASQFCRADLILVAAPVWNYYVPAILKSWIDQVLSPGQVFQLGEDGRTALHQAGALINIVSAGGWMSNDGLAQDLFRLLNAPFRYIGIEHCHDLLIEAQEPAVFSDHAEREAQAIDTARKLADELAADLNAGS